MKKKTLAEIKYGEKVMSLFADTTMVTYDWVVTRTGLTTKQVQKVLADLCKYGYISKHLGTYEKNEVSEDA